MQLSGEIGDRLFVRLWAGYGGFALTVMEDPASSLPYRSYEVIDER